MIAGRWLVQVDRPEQAAGTALSPAIVGYARANRAAYPTLKEEVETYAEHSETSAGTGSRWIGFA
jgi:hypothetical protein